MKSPVLCTDIDGNIYRTLRFGEQVWTLDNLRVTRYQEGSAIHQAIEDKEFITKGSVGEGVWCHNLNRPDKADTYGLLYNWFAVHHPAGLAPAGWRIPTKEDWDELKRHFNTVDGVKGMKGIRDFCSEYSGSRGINGAFGGQEYTSYWWRQMPELSDMNWGCRLSASSSSLDGIDGFQRFGFSVRCVLEQ